MDTFAELLKEKALSLSLLISAESNQAIIASLCRETHRLIEILAAILGNKKQADISRRASMLVLSNIVADSDPRIRDTVIARTQLIQTLKAVSDSPFAEFEVEI